MTLPLPQLVGEIIPEKTVLFFGAGSSVPSKAPSVDTIKKRFAKTLGLDADGYSLSELASLLETKVKCADR
jgi:hypothetical protein